MLQNSRIAFQAISDVLRNLLSDFFFPSFPFLRDWLRILGYFSVGIIGGKEPTQGQLDEAFIS